MSNTTSSKSTEAMCLPSIEPNTKLSSTHRYNNVLPGAKCLPSSDKTINHSNDDRCDTTLSVQPEPNTCQTQLNSAVLHANSDGNDCNNRGLIKQSLPACNSLLEHISHKTPTITVLKAPTSKPSPSARRWKIKSVMFSPSQTLITDFTCPNPKINTVLKPDTEPPFNQ